MSKQENAFCYSKSWKKGWGVKTESFDLGEWWFWSHIIWVNDSYYDSSGLFHSILCDPSFELYFASQDFKVLNMKIHDPFIFEGYDS